jgi:X-X-X-Leu-X-X-Gly heptad repeat protein
MSRDFSVSVSCSEYEQRALNTGNAAEANGAERVSCEVGTAELALAENVAAGPQATLTELLTDEAELMTGTAEVTTGTAELLPVAAELMTGAGDMMSGAAELKAGAAELITGVAELMTGEAEVITGVAELMTGEAEVMAREAGVMFGAAELMTAEAELVTRTAGLTTIAEWASRLFTGSRDTRVTSIFFLGSRLKGYTRNKESKLSYRY